MTKPNLPIRFEGAVIDGAGRGKDMGIPTLNLALDAIPKDLPYGIYAGQAWLPLGVKHFAAIHYGPAPVYNEGPSFEVHFIDVDVPKPPESLEVELVEYLREVKDFDSETHLIDQIERDIEQTRAIMRSQ